MVYLSVIHSDRFVNVPHFAGKFAVERMIEAMGFAATILRPAYFIDNDRTVTDVVVQHGIYPMPLGHKGLAMIDARDIGEIAALELIRRERDAGPLTRLTLVGPETLTGRTSRASGRRRSAARSPMAATTRRVRAEPAGRHAALDGLRPAPDAERFQTDGMIRRAGDRERLTALLGRRLHGYRDFAATVAASA